MSDREQAIEEFADACGYPAETIAEVIDDEIDGAHKSTTYAVSQRERVIALERALLGLDILLDFGDIIEPNTAQTFDDPTAINAAFAAARAALNGDSK